MTTDLCAENVVVQISTPQMITTDAGGAGAAGAAVGGGGGGGRGAAGGPMELGRRLLLAARAGDTALVLELMAQGAPFTTDWLGTSPLHLAAMNAHVETCGVLVRAGVSREARTKVERTPLHLAAHAGHAAVAALLLRGGAAADARDLLRMTPLHWAAQRGHAAVARLLLRHGADPLALSKFHKTPLQLAARANHLAAARLLEDAVRQREAAKSVRALVAERLAEEPDEPQPQQTFATVQKLQEIKLNRPKLIQEKTVKIDENKEQQPGAAEAGGAGEEGAGAGGAGAGAGGEGAAALLRRYGIALMPPDHGGTVLSALQHGRTVVLSDAGKLMLKESVGGAGARAAGAGGAAKAAPRVFSVHNRLAHRLQATKQVKLVQLPAEARVGTRSAGAGGGRPPVKIIMNKTNFERLVASARPAAPAPAPPAPASPAPAAAAEDAPQLRAALAASQRTVSLLTEELRQCRARLAQYEAQ